MTQKNIVIAGSGFAGVWAALAAARAVSQAGREGEVAITVVSPSAALHIRPRLYETAFDELAPDVSALFAAVGVRHLPGRVERIHAADSTLEVSANDGTLTTLRYDRFVLATGSRLFTPDIPGLREYSFNVDQLADAQALDAHLKSLAGRSDRAARTVVVAGGGFTGIETAADMPQRLRAVFGDSADVRVIIVEQAADIGPDLGPGPRPVILEALGALGVDIRTSARVTAIDADGVTLEGGERIAAATVVWTAGARANALAAQVPGEHDRYGRLVADAELRAGEAPAIFVAGDVVQAATDDLGNVAAMSCQHALSLGRVAGHNAAAELVGLPTARYSQPKYVTCLDLGPWGAVYTEGWDRQVKLRDQEAKALKRAINTQWIYPPAADRDAALALADPYYVIVP